MKVSEILKILKKDGWYLEREGRRHSLYVHPTKEGTVVVPRHPSSDLNSLF
ncbi:type II toxin-antitoxin system HicA family toxin [Empedobacter falsenii]